EVGAPARVLFLVELDPYAPSARERQAVLRRHAREGRLARDSDYSTDLLLGSGAVGEVVKTEDLAELIAAAVHQREVVERELRDEPPELRAAERRLHHGSGLHHRGYPTHRTGLLQLEVARLAA